MTWMVAHTFVDILALDNASANNVLLQALAWLLMSKFDIQFVPANSKIRCIAHVVNLVVQRLLAALDDAEDPDTADVASRTKIVPSITTQTTIPNSARWSAKCSQTPTAWGMKRTKRQNF
ncbi:hypothetical protein B0H14DRAFT_2619494 [Mycena olivaceomarginata]|nr:hypothetical protein B0H14DRAFT_2619494 [Mycena olivaceomarginata]